jgi:arylsulfatase A-like enzyme
VTSPALNQRLELKITSFAFLSLLCLVGPAFADDRPHIVLVMADDHGYGDTGYTGHPFVKTPNLDAMAGNGVVFNRLYASAPVCSPTRASFMTGRHPFRANVPNHGHYMRPQEKTIAEALKTAGYVTGHFGKWHIGSVQPDSPTNPGGAGFDEWLSGLNFFDNDPYLSRNGKYEHIKGPGTVISMDATIDFLTRHKDGDKPMLTVTWFPSPHDPHQEISEDLASADTLYSDQNSSKPGYFREITLLDQQVGRLRQCLRDLKIESNTFFLYCSDNGGLVADSSGGRAKKGSIYEGGLRVPAILQWPARYKPKVINTDRKSIV